MSESTLSTSKSCGQKTPIVCFSHLGWDTGLFQRPQQIMTRLAEHGHPVYYFACVGRKKHREHPMSGPLKTCPDVSVYTLPFSPGVTRLKGIRRWAAGLTVARQLVVSKVKKPVLWFYHPSLFALGYSHTDSCVVYDVMDHFPSFEATIDDTYFDELTLLAETDLVFTGGRSIDGHVKNMIEQLNIRSGEDPTGNLEVSPRGIKPTKTFCFPSGVDLEHFAKAINGSVNNTQPIPALKRPVFGYFGAIDERIDWELINTLAKATDGNVVLAGPVLKKPSVKPAENVHLPGAIPYEQLPDILARFDVCLIPFINSSLVGFVSPTKTPEYLAGGKPVVSTAIPDVISDYGNIVKIGNTPEEFVNYCIETANGPTNSEYLVSEAGKRARTWDQIATEMNGLLSKTISKKNVEQEFR